MSIVRGEVQAVKSDGTPQSLEAGKGSTLPNGTYFYSLSNLDGPWEALSLKWDSAIVFTAQFEETCLPKELGIEGSGTADVSDLDVVAGNWIIWPMPAGQVSVIATDASTGGATYAPATGVLTVAGGTAGGARMNLPDIGGPRGRLKVVVTTPGKLRVAHHRKS